MKKVTLILLVMAVLTLAGCQEKKTLYLPSADNDAIFTIVGGGE